MGTARLRPLVLLAVVLAGSSLLALGLLRPAETTTVRVLLVGDSVTQGSSGDWTWRYRLSRHLSASSADVDLVGPRDDLLDTATATFGSQQYVDPAFDRDHAARWGMALGFLDPPIEDLVRDYRPDVVVELLGVNDLAWRRAAPTEILDELRDFVGAARSVDPDVDFVLGELPQVWLAGVPELNAGLADLAEDLDEESSRVVTAAPGSGFVEGVDTYDAAHLSATGEVIVAAGVADALAVLGIGSDYPRPLPAVPNGPRRTAVLTARPGDGTVYLSWRPPPGATGEFIWMRNRTLDEPWTRLAFPVADDAWTAGGLVNGHDYEFRLQSAKGTAVAEDRFSNVVSVRPDPQAIPPIPLPVPPAPPPPPPPLSPTPAPTTP